MRQGMQGFLWAVVSVAALCLLGKAVGLTCLTGTDVAIPRDNTYVRKCGPHEVCFIDAFASANGIIKYNIGCRDAQFCHSSTGKRASGNTKFCETCCTTDLCNSAGCGAHGYVPRASRGPICYHCTQQRTPETCDKITVCGKDSICKVKLQPPTVTGDVYYASYCENKQTCEHDASYQSLIVGRKRYSHTVLAPNKACVVQCCDSDLCSGTCGTNHAPPNIGHVTTAPNPCASNPCMYGTCSNHGHSFNCNCQTGYTGTTCSQVRLIAGCPDGWRKHGSSCYLIDAHRRGSWNSANTVCQRFGGYLAEINSASENAYLLHASTGTLRGDWWIGGNDKASEGYWRWSHSNALLPDNSPNWGRHRPNNIISGSGEDEDCLEFAENIQAWNDEHCSDGYNHYICERPVH